jgi:squalene cyclase
MSEGGSWGLLVAFPDGSPSFVHGFEAGQISERLTNGRESEIENLTVHAANEEVIRRLCIAQGWECTFDACKDEEEKVYDTYRVVTLRKVSLPPSQFNPHGLRVV